MRWQLNRTPQADEVREVEKFAWFPVRCDLDIVVWWEPYLVLQSYDYIYPDGYYWQTNRKLAYSKEYLDGIKRK